MNKENLEKIKECDFIYFLAFDIGGSTYLQKYQNYWHGICYINSQRS